MKFPKKANSLKIKTGMKAGEVIGTIIGTGIADFGGIVARYIEVQDPYGLVSQWVKVDDLIGGGLV